MLKQLIAAGHPIEGLTGQATRPPAPPNATPANIPPAPAPSPQRNPQPFASPVEIGPGGEGSTSNPLINAMRMMQDLSEGKSPLSASEEADLRRKSLIHAALAGAASGGGFQGLAQGMMAGNNFRERKRQEAIQGAMQSAQIGMQITQMEQEAAQQAAAQEAAAARQARIAQIIGDDGIIGSREEAQELGALFTAEGDTEAANSMFRLTGMEAKEQEQFIRDDGAVVTRVFNPGLNTWDEFVEEQDQVAARGAALAENRLAYTFQMNIDEARNKVAQDWEALPGVKQSHDLLEALNTVMVTLEDSNDPVAAMGAIIAAAQIVDPGVSVKRDDEQRVADLAPGAREPNRIITQFLDGGTVEPEQARALAAYVVDVARAKSNTFNIGAQAFRNRIADDLIMQGENLEDYMPDYITGVLDRAEEMDAYLQSKERQREKSESIESGESVSGVAKGVFERMFGVFSGSGGRPDEENPFMNPGG